MKDSSSSVPLIVAAMARELRPLIGRAAARRTGSLPFGDVYAGRLGERPVTLATLGDGAERFAAGLEAMAAEPPPSRVLLIGVAGGLSPGLEVGEVIRADRVLDASADGSSGEWRPSAVADAGRDARQNARVVARGTVVSAGRIVGTRAEKAALWRLVGEPERAVVDLESAVFARHWSARDGSDGGGSTRQGGGRAGTGAGVEWTILRAVSDPREDDLPLDFAAASDSGGHVVGSRLARQLAAKPGAIGALGDLRRRVALCADRLAAAAIDWVASA